MVGVRKTTVFGTVSVRRKSAAFATTTARYSQGVLRTRYNRTMPARPLQRCPMCLLMKPVVESHLIPEALYSHVTDGKSSPIRVGDGYVIPTDRQIKTYLLCLDCEDILR